ncbi:MAG: PEP/pyruvate-binding domain-containing protein, partial [Candidatus Nanoarchaeia archaeon]
MADVAWFRELHNTDVNIAGGKGASLGEMYNAGMPIPPGFVITAEAFKKYITKTKIDTKIYGILKGLNVDNNAALQETSKKIQALITSTPMPEDIKKIVLESYDLMSFGDAAKAGGKALGVIKAGRESMYVAVRSSATAEDLPNASFAGQQASFLNVKGANELIKKILECWASLFTARAIYYRTKNNFEHSKVLIAVVVQKMVNSDKAGVMFSVNPVTGNEEEIMIECSFGLGEAVVSGSISPDQYVVDKKSEEVKQVNISNKNWMYTLDKKTMRNVRLTIPQEKATSQALSDFEIIALAKLAKKIEQHYGRPQDLEY